MVYSDKISTTSDRLSAAMLNFIRAWQRIPYAGELTTATVAINILALALPVFTLQIYDRIIPNLSMSTLSFLVAGVILALFMELLLRFSRSNLIGRATSRFELEIGRRALDAVLDQNPRTLAQRGLGAQLSSMAAVSSARNVHGGFALITIIDALFIPILLWTIFYIGGAMVMIPIIFVCVLILICVRSGNSLVGYLEKRNIADERRLDFLVNTLSGIHTAKSLGIEPIFCRKHEKLVEDSAQTNRNVFMATSFMQNLAAIVSASLVVCTIWFGVAQINAGRLGPGGLVASLLLASRVINPVFSVLRLFINLKEFQVDREQLNKLLSDTPTLSTPTSTKLFREGRLEITNLSVHDGQSPRPIFENVSLNVRRGDSVLLRGEHGSGKSALLKTIARIYEPSTGQIEIDGKPLPQFSERDLSDHVAYLPPNGRLFRGTIRENVTCFGQTPESKVREVAQLLQVDRDVSALPLGFDTYLENAGGNELSPGLIQRLVLVRALARKPRLILFDNADSMLDQDGYQSVYRLLARLKNKATLILISDDSNIMQLANREVILKPDGFDEVNSDAFPGHHPVGVAS